MTYPGGKGSPGVVQQIINQMPPHRVYIEPFLGSGVVFQTKRPAEINVGIDKDQNTINQFWDKNNSIPGCNVICGDAISILRSTIWRGDEFVYCDPPYLFETRAGKRPLYTCEFGDAGQHKELLSLLKSLPCMVAISGYWSSLYNAILPDWRTITYTTRTRGGRNVQEWLWMNYPEPVELHDYRFLGDNFRERERVSRIRKRWIGKMNRLQPLERYALFAAFDEYRSFIAENGESSSRLPASQKTA